MERLRHNLTKDSEKKKPRVEQDPPAADRTLK
jgi:hypothetical protein